MRFKTIKLKYVLQVRKGKEPHLFFHFLKPLPESTFTGGQTMIQAIDSRLELSQFLIKNVRFLYKTMDSIYAKENKSYISSLLKENGDLDYYEKFGNPFINYISTKYDELKTEDMMDYAKESGMSRAKTEFPIHLSWEIFQSCSWDYLECD